MEKLKPQRILRAMCRFPDKVFQENELLNLVYGGKNIDQFQNELEELIKMGLIERIEDQKIVKLTLKGKDWCINKKWPSNK